MKLPLMSAHRMLNWRMQNCLLRSRQVNWHGKKKRFVNFSISWTTLHLTLMSSGSVMFCCSELLLVIFRYHVFDLQSAVCTALNCLV